jgi:hypothetical protein
VLNLLPEKRQVFDVMSNNNEEISENEKEEDININNDIEGDTLRNTLKMMVRKATNELQC